MPPAKCDGCPDCNTTLEIHPDYHKTPEPHDWVTKYDENTGKPYRICQRCYRRAEVKEHGTRVGEALGPLTQDRFTGWLYDGYMVVIHENGDEVCPGPHICAVFKGNQIIWLDEIATAGRAILAAAGVRCNA